MNNRFAAVLFSIFCLISSPVMAKESPSKAALTSKAMQGNIQAQYDLCLFYQKEGSADFAMSWCEKAAVGGNTAAQLQLAWLTIHNAENEDDLKKGYIWFGVSLAQEYNFAGYNEWQNLSAHFGQDKKTLKRLRRETNKFFKKYVRPLEERPVVDLIAENQRSYLAKLKNKAKSGDAESQALLGTIHEYGGDFALALDWYRKAAKNGYIDAQSYLGRSQPDSDVGALYDDGERYAWMSVALSQQYNYVDKLSLSLLAERLGEDGLPDAKRMAQDYYRQYVTQYERLPVEDLIRQAENTYMQKLIDQAHSGNAPAQYDLARKYKSGIAILKDLEKSMEWHIKAAESGSILAQYTLGHMYEEGIELPKKPEHAAKWYKRAAMQGYHPAQFALGQLYLKNIGESGTNIIEAYAWLDVASKQGHQRAAIARDAIIKSFNAEESRLAGILARKYYRLYVEPFLESENNN